MQEYVDYVQKGFRVLVGPLAGYIGQQMNVVYRDNWWEEVRATLNNPWDIPVTGSYSELVDSLDIANCIRIIDRRWNEVFREQLPLNCRVWAKELMGYRNVVSHQGQTDLEQPVAERALDTMALLCQCIDPDAEKEIRKIYSVVRSKAQDNGAVSSVIYNGVPQPKSESAEGTVGEGSLLKLVGTDIVQKTNLSRKVTFAGQTQVYPVYRVRLDALYYNDQNDRISTWISQYEAENGENSLAELNRDIYNRIIEGFIVASNEEAIKKTANNIALFGQQEPGVTLADGRVVDGNRRLTCIRRLQRDSQEPMFFETVIMEMDIHADKKQIKLLELAIQHGEEGKLGYDLIDFAIGTYRDIEQTKLLTVEEYAAETNERIADVNHRIEIARIICEFLEYLRLPEQYHIAREFQVYSLFQEMNPLLKKMDDEQGRQLKITVFNNAMMRAVKDQRKYIRDVKTLVRDGEYGLYLENMKKWNAIIEEKYNQAEIHTKADIEHFAKENAKIAEELEYTLEASLQRSRSRQMLARPSENVLKSINLMSNIDSRLFDKLDETEKETLINNLDELGRIVDTFKKLLS